MFMRAFLTVAIGVSLVVPLPAAPQTPMPQSSPVQDIDLAILQCAEFLRSDAVITRSIVLWLAGFYTYEDDPTIISRAKLEEKERQIRQYCSEHQGLPLISVAEIFMDKKYTN